MKNSLLVLLFLTAATSGVCHATDRSVLIVVGMKSEADLFAGRHDVTTIVSANQPDILLSRLQGLDPSAYSAVISFGMAGGLDTNLQPGQLVLGTQVTDGLKKWPTSVALTNKLLAELRHMTPHPVSGGVAVADRAKEADQTWRVSLQQATGAIVTDNDSALTAEFANRYRIPLAILRAVADPAARALPPAALIPLQPDGTVNVGAISLSMLKDATQIPDLMRLSDDVHAALVSLKKASNALQFSMRQAN